MFQALAYLRFLWHSKNEYGVHSPFVYDLLTHCIYDKTHYREYEMLGAFRQKLLQDQSSVDIDDVGAGSRVFSSPSRKISEMANTAGSTDFRSRLLFRLTRYLKSREILELGTSLGIGTFSLALGNPDARVQSVEGSATAAIARNCLKEVRIENAVVHQSLFGDFIDQLPDHSRFDLVFFDGHHDRDATLEYFNKLKRTVRERTLWIFDDIHWSKGMEQAWQTIVRDPDVTVSIDTFRWGLVFFRSGQAKEHFVLHV